MASLAAAENNAAGPAAGPAAEENNNAAAENNKVVPKTTFNQSIRIIDHDVFPPGFQHTQFKLDVNGKPKFFIIKGYDKSKGPPYQNPGITSMTDIITGESNIELDDGVYTWIIGTKMNIKECANSETVEPIESSTIEECDTTKLYIWLLKTITIQEIGSKHFDIVLKMRDRMRKLLVGVSTDEKATILSQGIIDRIYFAGELKKKMRRLM